MPDFSDPLFRHEIRDRLAHALEYVAEDIKAHAQGRAGDAPRQAVFDLHRSLGEAQGAIARAQTALESIEDHYSDA